MSSYQNNGGQRRWSVTRISRSPASFRMALRRVSAAAMKQPLTLVTTGEQPRRVDGAMLIPNAGNSGPSRLSKLSSVKSMSSLGIDCRQQENLLATYQRIENYSECSPCGRVAEKYF